jgi:tetratricopeptide (TPR) repeat protein
MESPLFVGRKVSKQIVKSLLAGAFGKTSGVGSNEAVPRLFLFHGADGTGKSTFIDLCMQSVNELGAYNGKPAASALIDLDVIRFRSGALPSTIRAMLESIGKSVAGAHERIAPQIAPFERLRVKIDDINWRKQTLIDIDWPRELFQTVSPASAAGGKEKQGEVMPAAKVSAPSPAAAETRFTTWIESKIDPADLSLAASADESLTALLADCLVNASLKIPFVLIVDSLELAGARVELWLRDTFLPLLLNRDSGIAVILSGSRDWTRSFRNSFPDILRFSIPFAGYPLAVSDIAELAAARNISLKAQQAAEIELASSGVPIAVGALLDYIPMKVPIGEILPGPAGAADADTLVAALADRFIRDGDDQLRMRVFSLALCYRFDKNLLSRLWGIPSGDVAATVADIAARYSFVTSGGRLHEAFRDRLRSYLIAELVRGADSPLAGYLKTFAAVQVEHQVAELERKVSQTPDPLERFADQKFQAAVLGYRNALLLSSPHELQRALPGLFLEALIYNSEFAERLLEFEKELDPLLPGDLHSMVGQLRSGLPIAQEAFARLLTGKRGSRGMNFMEHFQPSLNDKQLSLLHRLRGKLHLHAGNFAKAVEEFALAMKLAGDATPLRVSLFGDFSAAGYAFITMGDTERAIEAFSSAVSLRQDDFFAWIELARLQQLTGEHRKAAESLEAAVTVDPASGDAWYELGRECALLADHERAVEAFTHVTEIDPKNAAAWYCSALSLEALSKFPEAQDAANRVVAMVPDHWEALLVLGRVLAAQYYSRDAIDALNKVVAIKPDCIAAWESLGHQLLAIESFEDAATALEKAAGIDSRGEGLWHSIGHAWFRAGNFEKAVQACRKATTLRKDYFDAWVTLGNSFVGLKDFKSAGAAYQTAAVIAPGDRQIWESVGDCLFEQGAFQEAIDAYLKAVDLRSDTDGIWLSIGLSYSAQKKFTEAVDSFQKSVAINPNVPEAWFQQGRAYATLGWYEDAAASFAKTVELAPEAGDAWYHRGLALAAMGNYSDAIGSFLRATESLGSDGEVWFQLGLAHIASGGAESAVSAFIQSIQCDGNRPEAHHQLGLARESLNLYEDAVGSFQQALLLSPDRSDSLLHLGLCCNALSRYTEAAESLRKVLEIDPGNREALLPLALASHALGNYADAVDLYRKVAAFQPESEETLYNLALALHATKNYNEAFEAYLTVVRKWPAKDEAWYNLGLAYNAVSDYQLAIGAFREASRLNPESSDIWFELGSVYYATEQYGEAIQSFRKVIARNPAMFEAWYNLGNAYLIWGEFNDAIGAYKKAAELKPDEPAVWGCLVSAYHASGAYDKAIEAGTRALALKEDEPWMIGTLGLSKLLTGDSSGANALFERLLSLDTGGGEIERIAAELKKIAQRRSIAGAGEALQKLNSGMIIPSSGPLPGQGPAQAS